MEPAKADLQHIHDFIAEDSRQYARKVATEIVEKTDILDETPKLGKIVAEIKDENVRELHLYSYRILYEITGKNIEVLAVIHKRRNFNSEEIGKWCQFWVEAMESDPIGFPIGFHWVAIGLSR